MAAKLLDSMMPLSAAVPLTLDLMVTFSWSEPAITVSNMESAETL